MNKNLIINNKFLVDKEWWVEETDKEYILCVKHNGKIYRSSESKDFIEFIKEERFNDKESLVGKISTEAVINKLIYKIELDVLIDK